MSISDKNAKKIAVKLLSGGKSRGERIKAQRSAFKSHNRSYKVSAQPETKWVDTSIAITTGGQSLTLVNGLAEGADSINRIGRKVMSKRVAVKGFVEVNATTPFNDSYRVMLVHDKQSNGVAPVFQGTGATVCIFNAVGNSVNLFRSIDSTRRFEIYGDQVITVDASGPGQQPFTIYADIGRPTKYNSGNTATITDINEGSWYFVCANNDGNTVPSSITATVRFTFVDV